MQFKSIGVVGRSVIAVALGAALTVGGASLASAQSFHSGGWKGTFASAKVSPFSYASSATGGVVTAVTPTSVTVQSRNGTSTTYTLTSTTTYSAGNASTTISSLVVGDRVQIGTASGAPTTATSVTIELAELFGTVSSVNGNSINITDYQGFTRNIIVGNATTYTQGGAAGTLSDVTVGSKILAQGTVDANGTSLDALLVEIGTAGQTGFIYGSVTAVTSTSLTVLAKDGTSTTFSYTTSTDVKALGDPAAAVTLSDLAVGEHVGVAYNSSAATTAETIYIKLAHISGTVTAVNGDNITVQDHQGFTRMILVGTATTYSQDGSSATASDVVVGAHIRAEGVVDANGTTLDALTVAIRTPSTTTTTTNSGIGFGFGAGLGQRHHRGGGFGAGAGAGVGVGAGSSNAGVQVNAKVGGHARGHGRHRF